MTSTPAAAPSPAETLTARQQAIVPIGALGAAGDIARLNGALNQGLDAGLTVNEVKEILVQLYAYAGFPRSLNALAELMKVVEGRRQRGIQDAAGTLPSRPPPQGDALLAAGTANQTRLSGAPVKGALFDFAPAIDDYLKTHLFGDIFERDNLDWQSRELATLGMLSALPGAESQLQAHMRISLNVGLTAAQLRQLTRVLAERVDADSARRAGEALARHLALPLARSRTVAAAVSRPLRGTPQNCTPCPPSALYTPARPPEIYSGVTATLRPSWLRKTGRAGRRPVTGHQANEHPQA